MVKLLMLTPQVPYPPRQGTALRNWGILQGLAAHCEVSLLSFAAPDQSQDAPELLASTVARAALIPQPVRTMKDRLLDLVRASRPDLALRLQSAAFREQLVSWLDVEHFDWVLAEGLEMAPYLDAVWGHQAHPRVALDAHNCEYLLQKRAFLTDLTRPKRWAGAAYSFVQWRRLRRYEAEVCRKADLVIAVSDHDGAALRAIAPGVTPLLIPNGISVADYGAFGEAAALQQPAFVFTGTMDFRPNVDGVLWFVREVWPRIRAALPGAHFYVVGKRPHRRLEPLREVPGVVITGGVPDTRPFIRAATVYVVPLWVGGGTRFKILEAGAMQKPMVSTSLGAEGFPDVGTALTLADDADSFARACIGLVEDRTLRDALGARAGDFVASYDWQALLPRMIRRLQQ